MRKGGRRSDRCFSVKVNLPASVCEDQFMDMVESAIVERVLAIQKWESLFLDIDPNTIVVKRRNPKYIDLN